MNKIISTKTTSAVFLAIVLVTGTIAAISPSSFIIKGVNAQGDPYYGMDNDYDDSYGYSDYRDDRDKKKDDSYGYSDYRMDKDKKPYGTDSYYESQYSSYEPDYKPKHLSYDKDDRDKSKKDSSKSVLINKLKCINTNLNINGNNTGDINVGNKGSTGGYLGTYSSDGSGSGYGGDDGYNKLDKGFDCIINNNNTNTNIGGGGNQTIPPGPTTTTLTVTKTVVCEEENGPSIQQAGNIEDCDELEAIITPSDFTIDVTDTNPVPSQFQGSAAGTQVQIGAGPYEVEETPGTDVTQLLAINPNITLETTFTGDCAPSGTGTIETGVAETCNIINTFTIEEKATLTVIKTVDCTEESDENGIAPSIQQAIEEPTTCAELEAIATPSSFTIQVSGNNPQPNSFPGSGPPGTDVEIGAGPYTVTETPSAAVAALLAAPNSNITLDTTFEDFLFGEGCAPNGSGTIDPGESQICEIINNFTITTNPCDECFAALPANVQAAVNSILETIPPGGLPQDTTPPLTIPTTVGSIEELCDFLEDNIRGVTPEQRASLISTFAEVEGSSTEIATALIDCLIDAGIFNLIATTSGLTASNINTDTSAFDINTADPTASFSQPTIAQGTEEDLSAMEKITKLKTQWLDQLP